MGIPTCLNRQRVSTGGKPFGTRVKCFKSPYENTLNSFSASSICTLIYMFYRVMCQCKQSRLFFYAHVQRFAWKFRSYHNVILFFIAIVNKQWRLICLYRRTHNARFGNIFCASKFLVMIKNPLQTAIYNILCI